MQPRTQASSHYPSYQRRLGTKCDSTRSPGGIFSTSLTGDVTSEIGRLGTRLGIKDMKTSKNCRKELKNDCVNEFFTNLATKT